jgi:hypothetical protein
LIYDKMIQALNQRQAEIYSFDSRSDIWMRSLHPTGSCWAYRYSYQDAQVMTFAVFTDGRVVDDRHENLVHLFDKVK